jgi:hypothetical protein
MAGFLVSRIRAFAVRVWTVVSWGSDRCVYRAIILPPKRSLDGAHGLIVLSENSLFAVEEDGVCLVDGGHGDAGDVDVVGAPGGPDNDLGDIFGA